MELSVASLSDIGRIRTNNEDCLVVHSHLGLFVVCDGMGGHNAGEVASAMACDILVKQLYSIPTTRQRYIQEGNVDDLVDMRLQLHQAMEKACQEIYMAGHQSHDRSGMGTTCTAVLLAGRHKAIVAHVGDCRLYLSRQRQLLQLTTDHTYVQNLVLRGALTSEAAGNHPHGNVLSRAMGVEPIIDIDTFCIDMDPGDMYLLCSDGLYNYFKEEQELAMLLANEKPKETLSKLIHMALERGGHDNCSGIIWRLTPPPEQPGGAAMQNRPASQALRLLLANPLFSHLSYTEAMYLVGIMQPQQANTGYLLHQPNQTCHGMRFLLKGEVALMRDQNPIAVIRPGQTIAETSLIEDIAYPFTARCLDLVTFLHLRRQDFRWLIESQPVLGGKLLWAWMKALSNAPANIL